MSVGPLDEIEAARAQAGAAFLARAFFVALVEVGFNKREALTLTKVWLAESIRGAAEAPDDRPEREEE